MNEIEKLILKKFMYNDKLTYNQIWDKKLSSSSHFDYYLKKLIEEELIHKEESNYVLTSKGFHYISSLDGVEIKQKNKPVPCSFALAYKDGKILLSKRRKQPFLNHLNIPGGKIEFGSFSLDEALREFEEETGLKPLKYRLKLISEKITRDKISQEISHHIIGFFYLISEFEGNLLTNTREGDCHWYSLHDLKDNLYFKELDILIPKIISNENKISYYTFERTMFEQKITDYKLIDKYEN